MGFSLLLGSSAYAWQDVYGQEEGGYEYEYEYEADWTGSQAVRPDAEPRWSTQVFTGFEFQGETDLDDDVGEFDYWMWSLGGSTSRNFGEQLRVAFKADYRAVGYDFDLVGNIDPWETVHVFRLNPLATFQMSDNWSLLGGPIFEFSGEEDADFGDSLRGGAMAGLGYTTSSKRFFFAFGVIGLTEIEDDARIQPLLLAHWNITDGLDLGLQGDTSRGGEIRLSWTFERLTAGVGVGHRRERFRLNDDGPAIREEGVGEEESTVVKVVLGYRFADWLTVEGYGGVSADGDFRLEDEDGDKIVSRDYDEAGFGGFTLRFSF